MVNDMESTLLTTNMTTATPPSTEQLQKKSMRGFASLDPSRRQEIARKGGKKAHSLGKAHRFSIEEARVAGEKGRQSRRRTKLERMQKEEQQSA